MARLLLRWFRGGRRGKRAAAAGSHVDAGEGHAPAGGERVSDETMLLTSGLQLPDLARQADVTDPSATTLPAGLPEPPPGTALLVVHHGPQAGARFLLSQPVTGVGRSPKQDILLDDATVSRAHAEFVRRDDGFVVRDLNSLNGTYVGSERVAEAVLRTGDVVRIGKFRLTYHPGAPTGPAQQAGSGESPTSAGRSST